MSLYYVFYGEQLHSKYTKAMDFWHARDRGEIPAGSYRYSVEQQEWAHATEYSSIKSVVQQDVPPILRAMALMLGN